MRAISVFSLEAGTSTFGWRAWIAFRTRVSMSAMGSLVIVLLLGPALPARLHDTRDLAVQGELAEAQAAKSKLSEESARPAAAPAAVAVLALKLGRLIPAGLIEFQVFRDLGGSGHVKSLFLPVL